MNVAANLKQAILVEHIAQIDSRLLQTEILVEIIGAKDVDVVNHIVAILKDNAIALRDR